MGTESSRPRDSGRKCLNEQGTNERTSAPKGSKQGEVAPRAAGLTTGNEEGRTKMTVNVSVLPQLSLAMGGRGY